MVTRLSYILCICTLILSQSFNTIRFRNISIENGLSQTSILDIMQDKQGFMWFATQDGLNKYDGYSFTYYKYDPYNTNTISSNWVSDIFEDSSGSIWIVSDRINLNRYQAETDHIDRFRFYGVDSSAHFINKRLIKEDHNGNIWVVNTAGFFRFNKTIDQFERVEYDSNIDLNSMDEIFSIYFDSQNRLWVSAERDQTLLLEMHDNKLRKFKFSDAQIQKKIDSLTSSFVYEDSWRNVWLVSRRFLLKLTSDLNQITKYTQGKSAKNLHYANYDFTMNREYGDRLFEDKFHDIWILGNYALERYDPETETFSHYPFSDLTGIDSHVSINKMFEDSKGRLWFGTDESGLITYQRETNSFKAFTHNPANRNSITDNSISRIFEDRSGTLWIGTGSSGLNYFNLNKSKFENYSISNGTTITNDFIWSMAQSEANTVWLATNGFGLVEFDTEQAEVVNHYTMASHKLSSDRIKVIYSDKSGLLWLGTMGNGLMSFDPKTRKIRTYSHKPTDSNSLANNFINSIIEDKNGYLWLATGFGLSRFDKQNQFKTYRGNIMDMSSLGNNATRSLYQDETGHIWVGTLFGLYELNPLTDQFNRYVNNLDDNSSISQNMVIALNGDQNGKLFIGTFGGGLNIMDLQSRSIQFITSKNGLSNDVIYGILPDGKDIWLSTNQGLSNYNIETKLVRNYDPNDGLQNYEFNGGAYAVGYNGQFLFGGISGFNIFDPRTIRDLKNESPLVLTAFNKMGKSVEFGHNISFTDQIELNYNDNYFSFEFAALDYINSNKNEYLYKLEDFDPDWIRVKRNFATYTNIDPGTYTFRVKSMNNDLVLNSHELQIIVIIHPPFWRTIWFLISSSLVLIASIIFFYRRHIQKKINRVQEIEEIRASENEKIRRRTADDFHDEMGNKLTRIRVLTDLIMRKLKNNDSPEVIQLLESISENSKNLFNGTRDFIWSIDPNNDSFYELAIRMKDFGDEFFDNTGIDFHAKGISKILNNIQLSLEKRRQILLIFKETMTNVLKHSKAKKVTLDFRQRQGRFAILLIDDGIGFNVDQADGQGLRSIQSRCNKIGGQLKIISSNEGSQICFIDQADSEQILFPTTIESGQNG